MARRGPRPTPTIESCSRRVIATDPTAYRVAYMWKQRAKGFLRTLSGKLAWAAFMGIVQTTVRFLSNSIGLPSAILFGVVFGGAALVDFFTGIPSEWVWIATAVTLFLTFSNSIKATADLKRASAELVNATNRKQKLDQAEMGLRGPMAAQAPTKNEGVSLERLEHLYDDSEKLLKRDKGESPGEWRQQIMDWFERTESAVTEDRPNEAFMFRTVCRCPKADEKFDDCVNLLAAKLVKLRLIIGRMAESQIGLASERREYAILRFQSLTGAQKDALHKVWTEGHGRNIADLLWGPLYDAGLVERNFSGKQGIPRDLVPVLQPLLREHKDGSAEQS